jgi:methoxymalonate biosynthesis protein
MMEIAYRFSGFTDEACACVAMLPAAGTDGVERLHLVARRQKPTTTMALRAPDLADKLVS